MKFQRLTMLLAVSAWLVGIAASVGLAQALPQPGQPGQPRVIHTDHEGRAPSDPVSGAEVLPPIPAGAIPLSRLNSVSTSAAPPDILTIYEDFEDNWDSTTDPTNIWTHSDQSTADGGEYFWGKRDCMPFEGSFVAFSAGGGADGSGRSCTSRYPANARSWAIAGPLDLSTYISGTLSYEFRGLSEYNPNPERKCYYDVDDIFFVGANLSPDTNSFTGYLNCGDWSGGYTKNTIDLSSLGVIGKKNVYLGLLFDSDSDSVPSGFEGFSVDYLTLVLQRKPAAGPPGPVYLPMASKALPPTPPPVVNCPDNEPNGRPNQASAITTIGQTCVGTLNKDSEDDFYALDVGAGQSISIDLTDIPAGADYDLYLYDQSFATNLNKPPIAQSDNGGNADEHIGYASPKAQRYYIRLFSRNTVAPYTYHLRVNVT